jgi:hypothetical protein
MACEKCWNDRWGHYWDEENNKVVYYCLPCKEQKEAAKIASKEKNRQAKRANDRRRQRAQQFVSDYLLNHPCIDCGEADILVLDFDHLKDKEHNVSHMVRSGKTLLAISQEIEKCVVRCANCHRRKTAYENGSYRVKIIQGECLYNSEDNVGHCVILNKEKADEIRIERANGTSVKELAVKYGVSEYTVKDVLRGRTWK